MIEYIPNARPVYFVEELISMIDEAELVLSMRYHGCILAMLRGKCVFGLYEQKCFDLLERYGNNLSFSAALDYQVHERVAHFSAESKLAEDRLAFYSGLSKALSFVRAPYDEIESKKNSNPDSSTLRT